MGTPVVPNTDSNRSVQWHIRVNRFVAILSLGLIVVALIDYAMGTRDWYHNQKARLLLVAVGLFLQSIAGEFRARWVFWPLIVLSVAALVATFWLTYTT
jgi:hypothetical protein